MSLVLPESIQAPHVTNIIGFLQHESIVQEVKKIQKDKEYIVVEITGGGQERRRNYSGKEIQRNYSEIFGDWKHGFIVYEKGKNGETPVFAYGGPISGRVQKILVH